MPTGTVIADEARSNHLNDTAAAVFTNAALLPIINAKYRDLQDMLVENDVPVFTEKNTVITVPALAVSIPPGGGAGQLPTNFVEPIKLYERAVGQGEDQWVPMSEKQFEPNALKDTMLLYWVYREEEIKLVGATSIREVLLWYVKSLAALAAITDNVAIGNSQTYMAAAVAAQAALTIGHNPSLAANLQLLANKHWESLLNRATRKNQSLVIRKKGWRRPRRILVG
jgi:hypothetical protein